MIPATLLVTLGLTVIFTLLSYKFKKKILIWMQNKIIYDYFKYYVNSYFW